LTLIPFFAATDSFQYVMSSQPQTGVLPAVSVAPSGTQVPLPQLGALQYLPGPQVLTDDHSQSVPEPASESEPPSGLEPPSGHVYGPQPHGPDPVQEGSGGASHGGQPLLLLAPLLLAPPLLAPLLLAPLLLAPLLLAPLLLAPLLLAPLLLAPLLDAAGIGSDDEPEQAMIRPKNAAAAPPET
jgi:hypothetical protein